MCGKGFQTHEHHQLSLDGHSLYGGKYDTSANHRRRGDSGH